MYIFGCSSTNTFMIDLDYCDFRDNVCRLISFNVDLCFRIMSKCVIFTNLFDAKRHWHTALKTNSEQRIWIWFKSSNGSRQTQSSEDIILTDLFREKSENEVRGCIFKQNALRHLNVRNMILNDSEFRDLNVRNGWCKWDSCKYRK